MVQRYIDGSLNIIKCLPNIREESLDSPYIDMFVYLEVFIILALIRLNLLCTKVTVNA